MGAAEDGDEGSGGKEAFLALILPTDLSWIFFRYDRVQAIGKVPDVADMVDGRRGLQEIVHDRISDRQNLRIRFRRQVHFIASWYRGGWDGADGEKLQAHCTKCANSNV